MRHALLAAALSIALASCGQGADRDGAMTTAQAEGATAPSPTPTSAPSTPMQADTVGIPEGGIPLALQGNWGMVPADCTSTRGDAKGLLRVSATTLTFYESVGRLGTIEDRSDTSLRAEYAFTGEGMNWTREITLSASNGGKTLTRLDRGGGEPGGPFTYTKCAA